jgi:translation initiation factor IF-2
MSDTDNKPTLGRKPLGLKRSVEAGEVKQTFSHGRTNKVVVEVKRRKLIGKPGEPPVAPRRRGHRRRRRPHRLRPRPSPPRPPLRPARPRRNASPVCSARPRKRAWPCWKSRPAASRKNASARWRKSAARRGKPQGGSRSRRAARCPGRAPEVPKLAPRRQKMNPAEPEAGSAAAAPAPRRFTPVAAPARCKRPRTGCQEAYPSRDKSRGRTPPVRQADRHPRAQRGRGRPRPQPRRAQARPRKGTPRPLLPAASRARSRSAT